MSKLLPVIILLAALCIVGGYCGHAFADKSFYKFGDKPTFSYLPSYPHLPFKTPLNWSMDVMAPDGSCNIKGTINNNDGTCSAPSIILSDNDFTTFKNGIAILAVVHIQQVGMPAQNYCPVAQWVWTTQDDTFRSKYPENLVVPSSCGSVPTSLTITTSSQSYSLGQIISFNGTAQNTPIILMVISPNNNIVTVAQIQPTDDGLFSGHIQTGGALWKTTGVYTMKITQGNLSSNTTFTLTSAVPEFGPITALVMGVAIVSIIFISSKTGLRFSK